MFLSTNVLKRFLQAKVLLAKLFVFGVDIVFYEMTKALDITMFI